MYLLLIACVAAIATAAAVQSGGAHAGLIVTAVVFDVALVAIVLMPWNCVLTRVIVRPSGVSVTKWPGLFRSEIPSEDIDQVRLLEDKVFTSVWKGSVSVGDASVRLSRYPVAIDAWSQNKAVLVTSRAGKPALLVPPGRDPMHLVGIIDSLATREA